MRSSCVHLGVHLLSVSKVRQSAWSTRSLHLNSIVPCVPSLPHSLTVKSLPLGSSSMCKWKIINFPFALAIFQRVVVVLCVWLRSVSAGSGLGRFLYTIITLEYFFFFFFHYLFLMTVNEFSGDKLRTIDQTKNRENNHFSAETAMLVVKKKNEKSR